MKTKDIKNRLFALLKTTGWKEDRFGHYHKEMEFIHRETREPVMRKVRVKTQPTSIRIEVMTTAGWLRRAGDYYSRMVVLEDGSIRAGTFVFLPSKGEKDEN